MSLRRSTRRGSPRPAGRLPQGLRETASESLGAALTIAPQLPGTAGTALVDAAQAGFFDGLQAGCLLAAGVALTGAVVAAIALPSRPLQLDAAAPGQGSADRDPVSTARRPAVTD